MRQAVPPRWQHSRADWASTRASNVQGAIYSNSIRCCTRSVATLKHVVFVVTNAQEAVFVVAAAAFGGQQRPEPPLFVDQVLVRHKLAGPELEVRAPDRIGDGTPRNDGYTTPAPCQSAQGQRTALRTLAKSPRRHATSVATPSVQGTKYRSAGCARRMRHSASSVDSMPTSQNAARPPPPKKGAR